MVADYTRKCLLSIYIYIYIERERERERNQIMHQRHMGIVIPLMVIIKINESLCAVVESS